MTIDLLLRQTPEEWARHNTPEALIHPVLQRRHLQVFIKREDRLHPTLSGNKLYKLAGHLNRASLEHAEVLVSFGGFHSNHLHALAAAARQLGLPSMGIVRGHSDSPLSETLKDCREWGMHLIFVSRDDYRRKSFAPWVAQLIERYTAGRKAYVIPEGGGGQQSLQGTMVLFHTLRKQMRGLQNTSVCVPCGTGATFAGFLSAAQAGERVLGFSALKLGDRTDEYLSEVLKLPLESRGSWEFFDQYHTGGFGKCPAWLREFMVDFQSITEVPLDPVYTSKMMHGVLSLAEEGYFPKEHRIVLIHTGGLQGRRGLKDSVTINENR